MTPLTQPLRDEHKELFPHIESLKNAGLAVHGTLSQASLDLIDDAYCIPEHPFAPACPC